MPESRMDDAVNRLIAAFEAAGLPSISPASQDIDQILSDIHREIAPFRLPEEVGRWWRLVDPESIQVTPHPRPTSPRFALGTWQSHRKEFPGMTPRLLFPVAYESWRYLFVELGDPADAGGAVLKWSSGGAPFSVEFPSLSAYVELWATFVELGEFIRHHNGTREWHQWDPHRRWRDAQLVRLAAAPPRGRLGETREIEEGVVNWPPHWQEAHALGPQTRALRGASSTVAQLFERSRSGSVLEVTIRGRVTRLMGVGSDNRVWVDDGTGVVEVWCPASVCAYGPVVGSEFEFDIRVQGSASPFDWSADHREIQDRASSHDLAGAQAALVELYFKSQRHVPAADATAIRPVDQGA